MSTYTAEEFNKKPQEAYRQADKGEPVKINHNRYPDVIFELKARERGIDNENTISTQDKHEGNR